MRGEHSLSCTLCGECLLFCVKVVTATLISLHGPLWAGTSEYFIGDSDLLDASPVVLVAPDVPPPEEEEHGQHGDAEPTQEGLLADDREEQED